MGNGISSLQGQAFATPPNPEHTSQQVPRRAGLKNRRIAATRDAHVPRGTESGHRRSVTAPDSRVSLSTRRVALDPPVRSLHRLRPPAHHRSALTPNGAPCQVSTAFDPSSVPASRIPNEQSQATSRVRREAIALNKELESEVLRSVAAGYAGGIVDRDAHACTHPVSDKGFKDIVAGFNRAMADIHDRFPGVRWLEPPNLSRQDPSRAPGIPRDARYRRELRALCFREFTDFFAWNTPSAEVHAVQLAPANGFTGVVAKLMGHHLSSDAVVHPMVWAPGLRSTLDANLHVGEIDGCLYWELPSERPLPTWSAKLAVQALTGTHLGKALDEFAAGSIAWRLHPDYGRTPELPPMPGYLADWLHESFPFLDNGQPPESASESDSRRPGGVVPPSSTGHAHSRTNTATVSISSAQEDRGEPRRLAVARSDNLCLALETEIQWAILNGYAKGIIDKDHPMCTHPASDYGFWQIVLGFNSVMSDFHARFPALAEVDPPFLLKNDPALAYSPNMNACHLPQINALCFREVADLPTWYRAHNFDGTAQFAPKKGFSGVVAHEYGHHLSSTAVVPPTVWKPKLEEALRGNGIFSPDSGPRTPDLSDDTAFAIRVSKRARETGIGEYAGCSPFEFAAEAIGWRLHPDYAATPDAPRMPRFLENWLHECFPFLDNGQIPEPSIEFDPGDLLMPVSRHGRIYWMPRRELQASQVAPAVPARRESLPQAGEMPETTNR